MASVLRAYISIQGKRNSARYMCVRRTIRENMGTLYSFPELANPSGSGEAILQPFASTIQERLHRMFSEPDHRVVERRPFAAPDPGLEPLVFFLDDLHEEDADRQGDAPLPVLVRSDGVSKHAALRPASSQASFSAVAA